MATATLKLDKSLLEQMTQLAQSRNVPVKELIEKYLYSLLTKERIDTSSIVDKLYGSVTLPDDFDYKKELGDTISSKYK